MLNIIKALDEDAEGCSATSLFISSALPPIAAALLLDETAGGLNITETLGEEEDAEPGEAACRRLEPPRSRAAARP